MMMRLFAALIALFVVATAGGGSLAAPKVGVAAAVANNVEGIQGGSSRALATGSSVFEQERIRTGVESVAQLLFLDQTTLSVGPRSEVTLDRFVYDSSRNTGNVLLSATRGAFRFITGRQNSRNYTVSTPVATIGFRGTIASCLVSSALACVVDNGTIVIGVNGKQIAVKAGKAITVKGGKVFGPYTYDGVAFDIGLLHFPLFPDRLENEPFEFPVADDAETRLNDLYDDPADIIDDPCPPQECDILGIQDVLR